MAGISLTIHGLVQTADQWRTIEGQIKNVVVKNKTSLRCRKTCTKFAGRTRQSYAQTAGLFTSVSRSAGDLGKSTEEILAFTEDVAWRCVQAVVVLKAKQPHSCNWDKRWVLAHSW